MNAYWVGVSITVVAIAISWRVYRIYKRISRRCPVCGRPNVRRMHFIILPPEEVSRKFSLRSPTSSKFRWFVRRVRTCTFAHCQNNKEQHRRIWVVKTNTYPISLWHAWWTNWFHPEQYERPRMEYMLAMLKHSQELARFGSEALCKDSTDTPNLLEGILKALEDYFSQILGSDGEKK